MARSSLKAWITVCTLALGSCAAERELPMTADAVTTPATSALELVSVTPDTSAPLWVRAPIVLTFSAPVDPASVRAGVRLESSAGPVELSEHVEAAVVTLEIATPPLAPDTLTLSIGAELRDQAGAAATPATRSWQLPLWHTSSAQGASAQAPKLVHARDVTWLAWEADGSIHVAEHKAEGLRKLDPLPVEPGALLADLTIDRQGQPVVIWHATSGHVARYSASGWQAIDTGLDVPLAAGVAPRAALGAQDVRHDGPLARLHERHIRGLGRFG